MMHLNPQTRRWIPIAIFFLMLFWAVSSWTMMRFVLWDAQYRVLTPRFFDMQVVTDADFRRLAEPANREVKLSDGSTFQKGPRWDEDVLPNYKPSDDGRFHVLVTTKGTAHAIAYVEEPLVMLGFLAACGLVISLWNLRLKS